MLLLLASLACSLSGLRYASAAEEKTFCAQVLSTSLHDPHSLKFAVHPESQANKQRSAACGFADVPAFNKTGWAPLHIRGLRLEADQFPGSTAFQRDQAQAAAAGVLEGYLLAPMLRDFKINWFADMFGEKGIPPAAILDFVAKNDAFMTHQISSHSNKPSGNKEGNYWRRVALALRQMQYLSSGYSLSGRTGLSTQDFLLLNLNGDMSDLMAALVPANERPSRRPDSHCSALFKVNADFTDLFWAHTTWANFRTMTRSLKEYSLHFESVGLGQKGPHTVVFSSYPSILYSNDDFYQIPSTELVVIETTNPVINTELYRHVGPGTLCTWIRAIVANDLATSGPTWVSLFAEHNSGTYNNQWMILDLKLFHAGKPLVKDLFWVLEQEPGYCESADMTPFLARGYWPSYNRPFFPRIYEDMGYAADAQKYGDMMSYSLAPRANIFRQREHRADTLEGMKSLMRYNDWQNDPLSLGQAGEAISGRFDLQTFNPKNEPAGWFTPGTHGGIDSKVGSLSMFYDTSGTKFIAESGPTHSLQPVFAWSTTNQTWAQAEIHLGMPDRWDFGWVDFAQKFP